MLKQSDNGLKYLKLPWKILITLFLITNLIGLIFGYLLIEEKTSFKLKELVTEYRGNPENSSNDDIKFPPSTNQMYIFLHNHILSLSILFFIIGGIFLFGTIFSEQTKILIIIEPFISLIITFFGIFLLWKSHSLFAVIVFISGILMLLSYLIMLSLILFELWFIKS